MSVQDFRIGAASVSIDGVDIGLTSEDGVMITIEPDVHLHLSGKYGSTPVKASIIGRTVTVEINVAENTLANLSKIFAGSSLDSPAVKLGGVAGTALTGKSLVITALDGTGSWHFTNAVPTSAVEVPYSPNEPRVMAVTFQAMIDTEASEDENVGYFS